MDNVQMSQVQARDYFRRTLRPASRKSHAVPAPSIGLLWRARHDEIRPVRTDKSGQLFERLFDAGRNLVLCKIDESRRYARDNLVELGAPAQRYCACSELQAKIDQHAQQSERCDVQQEVVSTRGGLGGTSALFDQRTELILLTRARLFYQCLQDRVGGGQNVMQHAAMGQNGLDRLRLT